MKILFIFALLLLSAWADKPFSSGYIGINDTSQSKMFWLFYPAQTGAASAPVILRIASEPGFSVMVNNFLEIGPNKTNGDGINASSTNETAKDISWNKDKNLLFIDAIGTGFSSRDISGDIPTDANQYTQQFYYALTKLFNNGPLANYAGNKFYITSEDYGSRIAVVLTQYMLSQNSKPSVTGLIIGDPLLDPINQITEYGMYSYSLSLVDEDERKDVELLQMQTIYSIKQANWIDAFTSWINTITTIMGYANVSDWGNYRQPTNQLDLNNTALYLQQADSNVWFGADSEKTFILKSDAVESAIITDAMVSYINSLAAVLVKIPVLVHQSQDNLIINGPGTQNMLSKLAWTGKNAWNNADFTPWSVGGVNYGLIKNSGKLSLALVNKAGMYTGYNQPGPYLDMLNKWIANSNNWVTDKPTLTTGAAAEYQNEGNMRSESM